MLTRRKYAAPAPGPNKLYVPYGGAKVRGREFQAGEWLTPADMEGLTPKELGKLTRNQFHSDYEKAVRDFAGHPTFTAEDQKGSLRGKKRVGKKVIPEIGKRERDEPNQLPFPDGPSGSKRPSVPEAGRATLPEGVRNLPSDHEALQLSPNAARDFVHYWNNSLSTEGLKATARAGKSSRGFYQQAAKALIQLFGPTQAPRFIALLAATSPNNSVNTNLKQSVIMWEAYQKWRARRGSDSPPTEAEIRGILPQLKAAAKVEVSHGLRPAHDNNIVRALSAVDPGRLMPVLSGPKVDQFRLALQGMFDAAVNDVWEAQLMGVPQKAVEGSTRGGMKLPNGAYIALSAKHRQVAAELNREKLPGEPAWTPSMVQECAWGFTRGLAYLGARSRDKGQQPLDPIQVLAKATHQDIAACSDFVGLLLNDTDSLNRLRGLDADGKLGFDSALKKVRTAYRRHKKSIAKNNSGPVLSDDFSDAERAGLERVARAAGHKVNGFMGHFGKRRYARPLRYAAPESSSVMPPSSQAVPGQIPIQPPAPSPEEEHANQLLAFSPNTDKLTFEDALARVRSGNHKAFKEIVKHVSEQVGVKPRLTDAIGDSKEDGAENSVLQVIHDAVDQKTVDYLAAWYGLLANQFSVLAFNPAHNGTDSVYKIDLPVTDMGAIRKSLDKAGIPFRTLVPSGKGTKVIIFDRGRLARDQVSEWAGAHNATIRESLGEGRFIGGSSRTAARAAYRKIITAYESEADRSGGSVRAYRPPVQPSYLRSPDQGEGSGRPAPPGKAHYARGGIHAPAGGVIVRGLHYPGGRFIPSANLEKASYPQYQQVEQQRALRYRRADGSTDMQAVLRGGGKSRPARYAASRKLRPVRYAAARGGTELPNPPPYRNIRSSDESNGEQCLRTVLEIGSFIA